MSFSSTEIKHLRIDAQSLVTHANHSLHIAQIRGTIWSREKRFNAIVESIITEKLDSNTPGMVENGVGELARAVFAYRGPLGSNQHAFTPSQQLDQRLDRVVIMRSPTVDADLMTIYRDHPTTKIVALALSYQIAKLKEMSPIADLIIYDQFDSASRSLISQACKQSVPVNECAQLPSIFSAASNILEHYSTLGLTLLGNAHEQEHPAVAQVIKLREEEAARLLALRDEGTGSK